MSRKVVHFQCLKDEDRKETEEAGLRREGRLSANELVVLEAFKTPVSPAALTGATHVIIGGSGWSVWEDIPYKRELAETVREALRLGLPTLGICFGAQFLADLLGGRVIRDYAREERGTVRVHCPVSLAFRDPLFEGMPDEFLAQASHQDRIAELPPHAVPLAYSQDGAVLQAFRAGAVFWGVQFHPERSRRDVEFLTSPEHCDYEPHQVASIRRTLDDSPEAGRVLERFIAI